MLSAALVVFGNPFPGIVRAEETFDGLSGSEAVWQEEDDSAQQADSEIVTESVSLTEENRYDPELYKEPTVMYPGNSNGIMRISALTLEEYLVGKIRQLETEIDVSAYNIPKDDAGTVYRQILNNHPEIFYVSGRKYSWSTSTGYTTKYTLTYNDTAENIKKQRLEFEEAADRIVAQTMDSMSDVEKLLAVHDALILNCEYDKENLDADTVPDVSYTAYGALVNHVAVCKGYAEAYSYIVENRLGISCDIVSSDEMNHAWNMVELDDGQWYHVDTTWDDPTWDSIGRVRHTYFLLSDAEISDEEHGHTGWDGTHEAVSDTYDMCFWTDVRSAFCYWNGEWYYSKYNSDTRLTSLLKQKTFLDNSSPTVLYTENTTWNNYKAGYMYLDKENDRLYFNGRDAIYRLDDPDGAVTKVCEPSISGKQLIFGFTIQDGKLCYALQENPNLEGKQVIERCDLRELMLGEITGISAEKVLAVYDKTPKKIEVKGIVDGDRVSYAGNDGIYRNEQPEMIDAGTYEVDYRVERDGCKTFYGAATIEIKKAAPEYSVPEGLAGSSGSKLGSVELPDGFVWQSDKGTKLFSEGTYSYFVSYIPADSDNFETVTDILVEVTVTCPGHVYHSQATAPGEETVTCALCGDSYKSTISVSPAELAFNERGQSQTVTATVAPEQAVTWKSDNKAVATVKDGIVTAVGRGTTNITARAGNKTATVKVTVNIKETPTQQPSDGVGGTGGNTGGSGSAGGTGSVGNISGAGGTSGNMASAGSAGSTGNAGNTGGAGSTSGNMTGSGSAGSTGNAGNTGGAGSTGGNTAGTENAGSAGSDSGVDKGNDTSKDNAEKSDSKNSAEKSDSKDKPDSVKQPQDTSDTSNQTQTPATATAYEKGDQIRDKATKAVYEVTKEASESGKGGAIAYKAPSDKKASSVQIPKTVTLDGVTYKVTSVAANAFKNNKSLKKVTVGTNVTSIGGNAFYGCAKLKTITIGSNVRTIGAKAFGGCTSLTKVALPAKTTSIGKQAFYKCAKLKAITIKTTKLTTKTVNADAFKGVYAKVTVKVPAKTYSRYKKLLPSCGLSKKAKIVKQ